MSWELAGVLAGGLCVLAIYSFLYRENPFYRFFEHLFIGIATGYGLVETVTNFVWPDWLKPTLGYDLAPWQTWSPWKLLWFLPAVYGMGMYFMLSRKHNWVARVVIGTGLGLSGGMYFQAFFGSFLPLLVDSFKPLVVHRFGPNGAGGLDLVAMGQNLLFTLTVICVMTYFFFSFEHNRPGLKQTAALGRWLMMATFGAFFGATVMARMALLIDRLQFMIYDWASAVGRVLGA